jgi:transcriptional/translational regulatory protein YebC/TACO1
MPQTTVSVQDEDTARKVLNLMDDFEDHDDVQNVYSNFDIPDPILKKIEG